MSGAELQGLSQQRGTVGSPQALGVHVGVAATGSTSLAHLLSRQADRDLRAGREPLFPGPAVTRPRGRRESE